MAGFVVTKDNWDALMENDYVHGQIAEAVNTATPFRDTLKRERTSHGRMQIYGVQVGTSQGQGARAELGAMPGFGAGEYVNTLITTKYNYSPFRISGPAEVFGDKQAFVNFGKRIIKDTIQGFKLFTGRQCWGDGQGTLALVNDASFTAGDSTATVDSAYGVLWGSMAANTTFLIKRKMVVQFGSENNGGLGYEVLTVGATSFTFTPVLANNVADDAAISVLGSANLEITGALAFAATAALMTTLGLTTTYSGISRTTYPEWEGNVINASAALSLALIRSLRDTIYKRTDDEESNLFICSTEIARDYEALLQPGQRFVPAQTLKGGHTILEHDGLKISKDSKAPVKAFFLFDTKEIRWVEGEPANWLRDAAGIMRVSPGLDAKEALYRWYSELDCMEPRRQGYAYNITVS